jgi:hypothetical protein
MIEILIDFFLNYIFVNLYVYAKQIQISKYYVYLSSIYVGTYLPYLLYEYVHS